MTYSLVITKNHSDPTYMNDIPTWDKVREILRNGLDQYTISVHIYKLSSNHRTLGEKHVTMGNLWNVLSYGTDKVLI